MTILDDAAHDEGAVERVYRAVDRARAEWRLLEALGGFLRTLFVFGAALGSCILLDNLLHLPDAARVACAVALAGTLVTMLVRFVGYPLVRPLTDEMVAVHLERSAPDLENRLINAVLLSEARFRDPLARRMAAAQVDEAAHWVSARPAAKPPETGALWRSAKHLVLVAAGITLYGVLFTQHFGNALMRLVQPGADIPPITDTRLDVHPGDARILQGQSLRVVARVSGVVPEAGEIAIRADSDAAVEQMLFEGSGFTYELRNLHKDLRYRITAGDARTRWFEVLVRQRPRVKALQVTHHYPAYTGLPERTQEDVGGELSALAGSELTLLATTDRPVQRGHLKFRPVSATGDDAARNVPLVQMGPQTLRTVLQVQQRGEFMVHVADGEGITNVPQWRRLEAVPDAPPRAVFLSPGGDVTARPGDKVVLLCEAADDITLRRLQIHVQPRAGDEWVAVRSWSYEGRAREVTEGVVLDLEGYGLREGDSLAYYAQAHDGRKRPEEAGRSGVYHIRIGSHEGRHASAQQDRRALRDVIRDLVDMQTQNLAATRSIQQWTVDQLNGPDFKPTADTMVDTQDTIYEKARTAVLEYGGGDNASLTEGLARIASGPVSRAVRMLEKLRESEGAEQKLTMAANVVHPQEDALRLLRALLEDPAATLADMIAADQARKEENVEAPPEDLAGGEELAERLLRALEEFEKEQKRALELSNQLSQKMVDDFTGEDEEALREILETERKWADFFQEAVTDLSKLPPQDFSLASQAQEFREVYSELQKALEAVQREAVELAVPHEQAGLELAEEIETNLEQWLTEESDYQKWVMEDPVEDYETPLTELPDELQDLIGELIEETEDMTEEIEDVTSGWADSLDIGAGWDTMDGPISNMSAKGVTGNRLPNSQEIGGRSGEGRTGKSSGQFVEEKATGKGGRPTPSRLTPDPFEAGWVDDTSGQPPTGATGGGKVSGLGAEGFQGPLPPAVRQELKRLARQQHQLIDRAERLSYGLRKYRAPRGQLPETLTLMKAQAEALEGGEIATFARYQRLVLANLREVKELTSRQKHLARERAALLPKRVRDEIANSDVEQVPERYRPMVSSYFRAISEGQARHD